MAAQLKCAIVMTNSFMMTRKSLGRAIHAHNISTQPSERNRETNYHSLFFFLVACIALKLTIKTLNFYDYRRYCIVLRIWSNIQDRFFIVNLHKHLAIDCVSIIELVSRTLFVLCLSAYNF